MKTSYFSLTSSHIYCYFGDTNDVFIDELLTPASLAETLHWDLKQHGYERILFFDYNDGAYFLDAESKQLMQGKKTKPAGPKIKSAFKGKLLGGNQQAVQLKNDQAEKKTDLSFNVAPAEMIRYTGKFMEDDSIRTAVIFPDALNMLEYLINSADNGSMLGDLFKKVSNISSLDNRNVMIFLFDRRENQIEQFFADDEKNKWKNVWNALSKQAVFHRIPAVSADEIRWAIHHMRLSSKLQVNCEQLDEICKMIAGKIQRNINSPKNGVKHSTANELTALRLTPLRTHLMNHFVLPGRELNLESCRKMCSQSVQKPALQRLEEMIGMQELKDKIKDYIRLYAGGTNKKAAQPLRLAPPEETEEAEAPNLHFIITGRKGTGKTTAARLIGEIMAEHGLLPSGHMVETRPSDLIGQYVGHSEANMRDALERARGGVLFIDEAYGFASGGDNGFYVGMVDELVGYMTAHKGGYAVIMAGYPDQMEHMLKTVNPGLKERFQNHIFIEDYTPEELAMIFRRKAEKKRQTVSKELDDVLPFFFENWYSDDWDDWANGRMVVNLMGNMKDIEGSELTKEMIPANLKKHLSDEAQKSVREQLEAMIGQQGIKQRIIDFENRLRYGQLKKRNYHFIFAGHAGTGKTTVAKLFGQLLKGTGVLKSGLVNVYEARQLITSPNALNQAIEKSKGRVLFIDEAYQLLNTPSVIDQLVEKTNPDAVDFPFCVICAGYEEDMKRFMDYNEGMERRFEVIRFDVYSADELLQIMKKELQKEHYEQFTVTEGFFTKSLMHFEAHYEKIASKHNAGYIGKYLNAAVTILYRRFGEKYGNETPPREAYVLDESVVPDEFCGGFDGFK